MPNVQKTLAKLALEEIHIFINNLKRKLAHGLVHNNQGLQSGQPQAHAVEILSVRLLPNQKPKLLDYYHTTIKDGLHSKINPP